MTQNYLDFIKLKNFHLKTGCIVLFCLFLNILVYSRHEHYRVGLRGSLKVSERRPSTLTNV